MIFRFVAGVLRLYEQADEWSPLGQLLDGDDSGLLLEAAPFSPVGLMLDIEGRVIEPASDGWLGMLLAHGMLFQSAFAAYLLKRAHISHELKLGQGDWGSVSTDEPLWRKKRPELPPPVPMRKDWLQGLVRNQEGEIVGGFRYAPIPGGTGSASDEGWALFGERHIRDLLETGRPIANDVLNWNLWAHLSGRYDHYGFERGIPLPTGKLVWPGRYLSTSERENYIQRLSRYYRVGRWLAWAMHAALISSGVSSLGDDEALWLRRWGIGWPDAHVFKYRNRTASANPELFLQPGLTLDWLRRLMPLLPPPGSIPSGSELRTPRRLAHWPSTGEMQPPIGWPAQWAQAINAKAADKAANWWFARMMQSVGQVVFSIASAYTGGAAGAVIGGTLGVLAEKGMAIVLSAAHRAFTTGEFAVSGSDVLNLLAAVAADEVGSSGYSSAEALAKFKDFKQNIEEKDFWNFTGELFNAIKSDSGVNQAFAAAGIDPRIL